MERLGMHVIDCVILAFASSCSRDVEVEIFGRGEIRWDTSCNARSSFLDRASSCLCASIQAVDRRMCRLNSLLREQETSCQLTRLNAVEKAAFAMVIAV